MKNDTTFAKKSYLYPQITRTNQLTTLTYGKLKEYDVRSRAGSRCFDVVCWRR